MDDLELQKTLHKRKKISWFLFSILIILLVVCAVYYFFVYRYYQSTDNAYVKADVTWIVPKVSGEVIAIDVQDNQSIKKGQPLLSLDNRDYQARYQQANAVLELKEAGFAVQEQNEKAAQASIQQAMSAHASAVAEYQRVQADYRRYQALLADGVITRQYFENIQSQFASAEANIRNAQSSVDAAKAQAQSLKAGRGQLNADVENARASVALYDLDRSSAKIYAPVDGKIGNLSVRIGSRVGPQTRLLAIIPDHSVYVEANFKETQIEKMRIGQKVILKLDAYPDIELFGTIESFSPASGAVFSMMPPDNATGNFNKIVQRVPVKIAIESSKYQELIKPGLSVVAKVDLRS